MVTSCPFGTSGFECSFSIYVIPAVIVIIAILFRKNIANDILDYPFSLIGSSVVGVIAYYIVYGLFGVMKYSLLAGIVGLLIGGFVLGTFMPDGESD